MFPYSLQILCLLLFLTLPKLCPNPHPIKPAFPLRLWSRRFAPTSTGRGVRSPPMRALEALQTLQMPRTCCSSRVHLCKKILPTCRGKARALHVVYGVGSVPMVWAVPWCFGLPDADPSAGPCPRSQCPTAAPIMLLLVEGPFIAFIPEIWPGPAHLATAMQSQSGKISS
ncbi:hypothetical protein CTAM01_07800 [Colletotrichum tamarilloi]|uniref:Secreted protein n=1 Tax=Colletotrichum tamarilloi TaxID=1209934 RepID=A0ABQ9R812_9PEZI|nr:uncharacterized protein CTAM01_07800 [Colletotrichum tamarilloi]KAK1497530.1 hypothetical protein CTAM01_07800 [Colletotrichum tamarilloi]